MVRKIYNLLKNLRKNITIATNANYDAKTKFAIGYTLITIGFKVIFYKNKSVVSHNIFGFTVHSYSYDILLFLFKEVFVSKDYFFESNSKQPKIIDCGANIGMSVLYFKYIFPDCSIIAFEPNPRAFYLLQRNIEQNNLKNVVIYNFAVSDVQAEIEFFTGNDEQILLASTIKERGGATVIKIKTALLSNFLTESVDLIKMDIEGSETKVMTDLISTQKETLAKRYIIEYHHKINNEKSALSSFLIPFENAGFEYNIKSSFLQLGAFQDVLLYMYQDECVSARIK